jgi:diguanylate cyclase (GGDEF)-like protein
MLNRPHEALEAALAARDMARSRNDAKREIDALLVLADIHARHDLPAPAQVSAASVRLHYLRQALEVAQTIAGYTPPATLLDSLSREYANLGDYPSAYETLMQAVGAREKLHAAEASQLAGAIQVQRETERMRADAEHQRKLAAAEARRAEAEIQRLAYSDGLTGLANRTLMMDHLMRAISLSRRNGDRFALLLLDLDHFKKVNDLYGHAAGDRLLKSVAARVTGTARAESVCARLGGDEFALLLPSFRDERYASVTARRVLEALANGGTQGGEDMRITGSIGIAVYPDDGQEPETLLKNAETAMRSAKEAGRNTSRFFTPLMGEAVLTALRIEKRLRQAIEQEDFFLTYQPKIDARSGAIVGAEALLRWRDPEPGFASPAEFIPVAERLGAIEAIGDWVLQTACLQSRRWQDEGLPPLPIAVNVSALEFDDPRFPARIMRALEISGLESRHLEIELTEGTLMKDANRAVSNLHKIKSLGVSIAIDDFGTGYSSLAYLGMFPINRLKIDQSFVKALAPGHHSTEITRTIIGIAKRLNMKVVAEGVETESQLQFLKTEQCDELQGYLFSKPLPVDEFITLLRRRPSDLFNVGHAQ